MGIKCEQERMILGTSLLQRGHMFAHKSRYSSLPNNCAAKPYCFLRIFLPTLPY